MLPQLIPGEDVREAREEEARISKRLNFPKLHCRVFVFVGFFFLYFFLFFLSLQPTGSLKVFAQPNDAA